MTSSTVDPLGSITFCVFPLNVSPTYAKTKAIGIFFLGSSNFVASSPSVGDGIKSSGQSTCDGCTFLLSVSFNREMPLIVLCCSR